MSSFLFFPLRNDFCPVYVIFQGIQFLIYLFKFQWIGLRNLNDASIIMIQVLWCVSKGTAVLCSQYCSIFSHHFMSMLHMACMSNTSLLMCIPIEN